jgi:hypothetical protein
MEALDDSRRTSVVHLLPYFPGYRRHRSPRKRWHDRNPETPKRQEAFGQPLSEQAAPKLRIWLDFFETVPLLHPRSALSDVLPEVGDGLLRLRDHGRTSLAGADR